MKRQQHCMVRIALLFAACAVPFSVSAKAQQPPFSPYQPTILHKKNGVIAGLNGRLSYQTEIACTDVRAQGQEQTVYASMCHTSYQISTKNKTQRPVTFLYNGGPGASSVYLHLQMAGPYIYSEALSGKRYTPVANAHSWLAFTDLVFIDPVGTGFSRQKHPDGSLGNINLSAFWNYETDLDVIAQVIDSWLTVNKRWSSPIVIGGESFGGWRTAALSHDLPANHNIPIDGALIMSPVLSTNYSFTSPDAVLPHVGLLPTLAESAYLHNKSGVANVSKNAAQRRAQWEKFALEEYLPFLAGQAVDGEAKRQAMLEKVAQYTGLKDDFVKREHGKISASFFARKLLANENKALGIYDASLSVRDPQTAIYADHPIVDFLIFPKLTSSFKQYYLDILGAPMRPSTKYIILNKNAAGRFDWANGSDGSAVPIAALPTVTNKLSFATQFFAQDSEFIVAHGLYDLVTPYFASKLLLANIPMSPERRKQIRFKLYEGGHMFYTHEDSRKRFYAEVASMYDRILKKRAQ